jgi:hypothetical protein
VTLVKRGQQICLDPEFFEMPTASTFPKDCFIVNELIKEMRETEDLGQEQAQRS